MKVEEFDYNLPPELIAQEALPDRDQSRLLVLDKEKGIIEHGIFSDLDVYFSRGDVLVLNDSRVFPARLLGKRKQTGGRVEIFLLKPTDQGRWQCLVGAKRVHVGLEIEFGEGLLARIFSNNGDSTYEVEFNIKGARFMAVVEKIGITPLPPYIKRNERKKNIVDKARYQTVYADENKKGSVAAPTAGLHFTIELLDKLRKKGVSINYITLHVGLGTFSPVKVADVKDHKMHAEWVEIDSDTVHELQTAQKKKKRIIAVGTTSARTLEAMAGEIVNWETGNGNLAGWVDIFIYPGYKFKMVDALITNFHLPKSTLLMLVSAFAGQDQIMKSYREAVKKKYRFFSYGDAMFIK